MTLAVDYAWTHPNPKAIKAAGYSGVLRYLSEDPKKNITRTECAQLHDAGLVIYGLFWETTATRAKAGFVAGQEDRDKAEKMAHALGYPMQMPLLYAVDFDAQWAEVQEYFKGAHEHHAFPVGIYGGIHVTEPALRSGLVTSVGIAQTQAWSGSQVGVHADIYQRVKPTRPQIKGAPKGSYDEDLIITHPGKKVLCWNGVPVKAQPAQPATAPAQPTSAPAPQPKLTDQDRAQLQQALQDIQNVLAGK